MSYDCSDVILFIFFFTFLFCFLFNMEEQIDNK